METSAGRGPIQSLPREIDLVVRTHFTNANTGKLPLGVNADYRQQGSCGLPFGAGPSLPELSPARGRVRGGREENREGSRFSLVSY